MRKSTSLEKMGVKGIIIRGKYTFVKIDDVVIKLFPDADKAFEKYVHGITAKHEKTGYGIFATSGFTPTKLPKITLKITI